MPDAVNCGSPRPKCDVFCNKLGVKRMGFKLKCVGMDGQQYICGSGSGALATAALATAALANAALPPAPVTCWSRSREGYENYCQAELPLDLGVPKTIATAKSYSCAIVQDDTVRCWGLA